MTAKEYMELADLWEKTPKRVMAENVDLLFGYYDDGRISSPYTPTNKRTAVLCDLTNTCRYTVLGWMNRSREDVKIPLYKLCLIADVFGVDVQNLLSEDDSWYWQDEELRFKLDVIAEKLKMKVF